MWREEIHGTSWIDMHLGGPYRMRRRNEQHRPYGSNESLSRDICSFRSASPTLHENALPSVRHRFAEPVLETDFAQPRLPSRNQRALTEFRPEVTRVRVNDNLPGIVARVETLTNQFIETELLRAGDFNRIIQWRADGYPADR